MKKNYQEICLYHRFALLLPLEILYIRIKPKENNATASCCQPFNCSLITQIIKTNKTKDYEKNYFNAPRLNCGD